MSFERKLDRLGSRKWPEVSDLWLRAIPSIQSPGSAPSSALSALPGLETIFPKVLDDGEYREEFSQIRASLLHEALYLMHKSGNVLAAAQLDAGNGILTWSLSSAYHSAFFAARSMIGLLGVGMVSLNGASLLVDVWPSVPKGSQSKSRGYDRGCECNWLKVPKIEHRHVWALLRRLLRVCDFDAEIRGVLTVLRDIETPAFAFQRNSIHYQNHKWPMDDLLRPILDAEFGVFRSTTPYSSRLESNAEDFSLVLAFSLLHIVVSMVKQIAENSTVVGEELALLEGRVSAGAHPLFRDWNFAEEAT